MLHQQFCKSERGSSLIEVIVSIMIITILSMYFMKYFYQAEQASATSDRKLIAANLARQIAVKWETARVYRTPLNPSGTDWTFSQLLSGVDDADDGNPNTKIIDNMTTPTSFNVNEGKFSINGVDYQSFVELSSLDCNSTWSGYTASQPQCDIRLDPYFTYMMKLKVTVFWDFQDGTTFRAQSIDRQKKSSSTVETFITREEIRR